ncbi:hydroxyacylglutathione hydrolase [Neoconidiobolus thromboides FSU 785]|nr:hydroxyacylglutathione hydrolase [Neoconidiobolus thromboides FSU 785]
MEISIVPMLEDNYAYILYNKDNKEVVIVDPVEPSKVLSEINRKYPESKLSSILTTHHHWDHSGGNEELHKQFPNIIIYGKDERIPKINKILNDGDTIKLGSHTVKCLATPGHTTGHLCYFIENTHQFDDQNNVTPAVFTGDTLFVGGCGRFFEGSPEDMCLSLSKLSNLPSNTKIYCGHEYTASNFKFVKKIDPDNEAVKEKISWINTVECTVPSTIEAELKTNPFMRFK